MNSLPPNTLSGEEAPDWVDRLLRESCPAAVADDGFSARVMQRLPPLLTAEQVHQAFQRKTRQRRRFEWFSLIGAVLAHEMAREN